MTTPTLNPAIPIPGTPLDAVQIQGNFAATWSDINNILQSPNQKPNGAIRGIYTTIDGGGSAILTGLKGFLYIPYSATITAWTLMADQVGSTVIDVWKVPYASFPPNSGNTIAGTQLPTLSSAQNAQNNNLNTWTTSVNAGDVLAFNVNSASTVTRVNMTLSATLT